MGDKIVNIRQFMWITRLSYLMIVYKYLTFNETDAVTIYSTAAFWMRCEK